jgi:hypothetical protein
MDGEVIALLIAMVAAWAAIALILEVTAKEQS